MQIKALNHAGIIVKNLDQAIKIYGKLLNTEVQEIKKLAGEGRFALFRLADGTQLELVELDPQWVPPSQEWADSISKGGVHHLCFEVENINAALCYLKSLGIKLWNEHARPGVTGGKIVFLSPTSTMGVLIELVEKND